MSQHNPMPSEFSNDRRLGDHADHHADHHVDRHVDHHDIQPQGLSGVKTAVDDADDLRVVARVLAGDLAAFELLMRRYNQRLFRVTRGILTNDAAAQDVVQETYLSAFASLHTFEGRARFATWLTRIAVHAAMARIKREKPMFDYQDHEPSIDRRLAHPDSASPDQMASNHELGSVLKRAVDALPTELRCVFVCRVVEQIDTRATAECLGLSEANVNVRLHRARAQLRQRIDQMIGVEARELFQFDGRRCDMIVQQVLAKIRSNV